MGYCPNCNISAVAVCDDIKFVGARLCHPREELFGGGHACCMIIIARPCKWGGTVVEMWPVTPNMLPEVANGGLPPGLLSSPNPMNQDCNAGWTWGPDRI